MDVLKMVARVAACFIGMFVGLIIGSVVLTDGPAGLFGADRWGHIMGTEFGSVLNLASYVLAGVWVTTCIFVARFGLKPVGYILDTLKRAKAREPLPE